MNKEYLIVLPVEPISPQAMYPAGESLPLHCTVMHWFRLGPELGFHALDQALEQIAMEVEFLAIEFVSKEPAQFGPNNDVEVHVLVHNEQLNLLHTKLFKLLAAFDSLPTELQWIGADYRPHVTSTPWRHFPPGTRHQPSSLALIERHENRDRFVVLTHLLGAPPF